MYIDRNDLGESEEMMQDIMWEIAGKKKLGEEKKMVYVGKVLAMSSPNLVTLHILITPHSL